MMKRLTFLAAIAMATLLAADAQAQSSASFFSTFKQTNAALTPFTYTRTAPGDGGPLPAKIAASTLVDFTLNPAFLAAPGPLSYNGVTFQLMGQSSSVATSTGIAIQDDFTGTFSITQGTTNLLTGTFQDGRLLQPARDQAIFSTDVATYTSDIFLPLIDEGFTFSLGGPFGLLVANNGAFQNFQAGVSSTFTAAVIPEPATLAMAGLGVLGLPLALRIARRRRSATSN